MVLAPPLVISESEIEEIITKLKRPDRGGLRQAVITGP